MEFDIKWTDSSTTLIMLTVVVGFFLMLLYRKGMLFNVDFVVNLILILSF